jgi:hypothetical protein
VFPNQVGVYIVWDDDGKPLYVGVAATQTLARRWQRQHLYPRAGGSALRRTLGVHLGLVDAKLRRPSRYYPAATEAAITRYLEGCLIEFIPTDTAEEARALETELIIRLDPKLNVRR